MAEQGKKSPAEKVKQAVKLPLPMRWLREGLAILLWVAVVSHLFVFDIGSSIRWNSPFAEIFRYRLLIVLGMAAAFWLVLGNRRFVVFFGYIVGYPFVIVMWIIPRTLFRNWAVVIAFSPAIYSIISTFKISFVLFCGALISAFLVCLTNTPALITSSMGFLAIYLMVHYLRRFRVAFSPSTVFTDVSEVVRKIWDSFRTSPMAARPDEGLDRESDEYKQKFGMNLLIVYVVATVLHFLGERLKEVVKSRKLDLYFLGSLIYTFVVTAIVFALEYFGVERLVPGSFSGVSNATFVDFLGFSFSTLMTSYISPIKAVSGLAQVISYFQLFGSLLIIVLLVFVILTSIRDRYRQDLDHVVDELADASLRAGGLLESNSELTITSAEAWLLKFNPIFMKWALELRYGKQHASEILAIPKVEVHLDEPK